ncbi:GLEYA domain-containing protein [Xylariales sp. PMI_506]|nr:GLEYA domain-containing protein [Xylariales sp. PMI_506]
MQVSTRQLFLLGLAATSHVDASPMNIISDLECLAVDVVVDILSAYSAATPFCSSFLHIPTITSTATATSSVTTTTTIITTTGTNTATIGTVTNTQTYSTTITTCILGSAVQKRHDSGQTYTLSTSSTSTTKASVVATIPAILKAFASQEISTACSCLQIPTPSTTVTATVTVTPTATSVIAVAASTDVIETTTTTVTSTSTEIVCPTPTQCDNQGLQFAEYTNSQGNNDDTAYSQFDPTIYKDETPNFTGVTTTAGGIDTSSGGDITVYGTSTEFSSDYFVLDHRGYLFAALNGTYTITVSSVDDAAFFWLGPDAYSGWTRANADASITYNGGPGRGSASIDLVEGEYLPIRIMFVQAQGSAVFQVAIASPDGTVFLSSTTEDSPYLIQYSCDGVTAPTYAPWGQEL